MGRATLSPTQRKTIVSQNSTSQADVDLLAQRIAKFIQYNAIDTAKTPMSIIVKEFFRAQLEAIDGAGIEALGIFS